MMLYCLVLGTVLGVSYGWASWKVRHEIRKADATVKSWARFYEITGGR